MTHNKYAMIQDILDEHNITDEGLKDAFRLSYFRGLSHCSDRERIIDEALRSGQKELDEMYPKI